MEGLRCWLAGYRDGRIDTWETAWSLYARTLGVARARAAVSALSCYARALNTWAKAGFEMMPSQCPGRCAHECLAIALVSAWQQGRREEAAGIADELVISGGLPETLEAAGQSRRHAAPSRHGASARPRLFRPRAGRTGIGAWQHNPPLGRDPAARDFPPSGDHAGSAGPSRRPSRLRYEVPPSRRRHMPRGWGD